MLSRTADHLFWMSRYMERAENSARMLDVKFHALAGDYFGSAAKESHEVDFYGSPQWLERFAVAALYLGLPAWLLLRIVGS